MNRKPKEQAKAILKDHSPFAITLAYLLPTMGLNLLLTFLMPDYYVAMMSMETDLMKQAVTMNGGLGLFLNMLVFYFGILMTFGYKQWALRVAKGQKPPLGTLIAGFGESSKVMWLSVLKYGCVTLWNIAMLSMILSGFSVVFLLTQGAFLVILLPLVLGLATVGVLWIQMRYSLVEMQLSDNLGNGSWWAMKQGVHLQRIAFDKMLRYYFSYWRWMLVYLGTVFGYFVLNIFFGAQGLDGRALDFYTIVELMSQEHAMAYWISTAVDWIFMLKFLPVFYVGLGVLFEEIKADEDNLNKEYYKAKRREDS